MTTAPIGEKLLTADEFLRLCEQRVIKGELVKGVVRETVSAGGEHGEVAAAIATEFTNHVRPRRLGRICVHPIQESCWSEILIPSGSPTWRSSPPKSSRWT